MSMSQIGRRLRTIRMERGLTQERLARTADTTLSMINRIEGGSRTPSIAMLERLAAALDVSPAALLADGDIDDEPAARPA